MKTNTKELFYEAHELEVISQFESVDWKGYTILFFLWDNRLIILLSSIFLLGGLFYCLKYIHTKIWTKRLTGQINIEEGGFFCVWNSIRTLLFHTIIIPISFLARVIIRAFIRPEWFLNPFLRNYILNPFHTWLLLNGLYDRLSTKDSMTHSLVVAKTWWGKSSSFVIPNLLKLDNCSIITVDLSWELFALTSWAMKKKWFEVKVINVTNLAVSERYNPLEFVKSKRDVLEIAHLLIYSNNTNKWDQFWNNWGLTLLRIVLTCLMHQRNQLKDSGIKDYNKFNSIAQARYLLNNFWENGKGLDEFVTKYADYQTFQDWKGFISWYEKTTQGFVSTALMSLSIFWNEEVAKLTASNSIDFKELRKKKIIYYFQVDAHRIHVYAGLIGMFYNQFFSTCMEELPSKKDLDIYALIEEAWVVKLWSNFWTVITNIRKYRCSISLICQNSLSQFQTLYWATESQNILNWGISTQIYFWGCDVPTCEMIERMIWNTISREIDWTGRTLYIKEPLMSVSQIRTMRNNEAILLFSNKKPILLFMRPYFKHYEFKKLSKIAPVEYDKKTRNDKICYMDLESLKTWEVREVWEKSELEKAEDEINSMNNPDFRIKEISQEKYQEYMIWDDFDIESLDMKTQTVINIIRDKIIQVHLNKEFEDVSDSFRFYIKKRVKKIMDKPLYWDCLKYIKESVVYEVDKIVNPPEPKQTFFHSYSEMCNYRAENSDDDSIDDISLTSLPWGSYTAFCKKRFDWE